MRIEHGAEGAVVLYDDHGQGWVVTLDPDGKAGDGGVGRRRAIRFDGPRGESIRVPFAGDTRDERDLTLDDVVPYFLDGGR